MVIKNLDMLVNNFFRKILLLIIKFIKRTKNYLISRILMILANILFLNSRKFYDRYAFLEDFELKIFSQNGEDGIIDFLVKKLDLKKPTFIEIGVGDYSEANTRFLYEMYYSQGLIVDSIENFREKVSLNVNLWRGNLKTIEGYITAENVNNIFPNNAKFTVDLFSIDIDGVDYWVINEIKPKISKIFILEYNPIFGSKLEVTVPNIKNFNRSNAHYSNLYFGASLKSYIKLLNKKGYYFLGVNRLRNNAFFINEDYKKEIFFNNIANMSLDDCVEFNFNESRDKNSNLNYNVDNKNLDQIKDCEVIDLSDNKKKLLKQII